MDDLEIPKWSFDFSSLRGRRLSPRSRPAEERKALEVEIKGRLEELLAAPTLMRSSGGGLCW